MKPEYDYYKIALKVLSSIAITLSTMPKSSRDRNLSKDIQNLVNKHKEYND